MRQIEAAARRVQRPLPPDAPVVAAGSGARWHARSPRGWGEQSPIPPRVGRDPRRVGPRSRWRMLAARAMLTVVKVGGSLGDDDALRAFCTALGELGERHPLLVVPGGAGFADAVRDADRRFGLSAEASHRMAILGMEQFGWLLSELIPGAERCADLARVGRDEPPCCCPPRCRSTPCPRRGR